MTEAGGSGPRRPGHADRLSSKVCCAALAVGIVAMMLLSACAEGFDVAEVLTIPYPFSEPLYPLTDFEHGKHSLQYKDARGERLRCEACHHTWDNVSRDPPLPCADCHTEFGDDLGTPRLTDAHHIRCTMCHREIEVTGRMAGPTRQCYACHVIEEPPVTQ